MEVLPRMLFREPDGRRKGFVFFLLSFICLLGWVYSGVVLDGFHFFLFVGIALALSGVAESLPPNRRRSAGRLRILAVGILVVFSLSSYWFQNQYWAEWEQSDLANTQAGSPSWFSLVALELSHSRFGQYRAHIYRVWLRIISFGFPNPRYE